MQTREILSIVALAALGLCLLCGLAKMAMKNPKAKQSCDHACSLLVFVAVVLVGVSQLIEEEGYKELNLPYWEPGVGALPWTFSGEGKMKKKKMSMGLGDSGLACCQSDCHQDTTKTMCMDQRVCGNVQTVADAQQQCGDQVARVGQGEHPPPCNQNACID